MSTIGTLRVNTLPRSPVKEAEGVALKRSGNGIILRCHHCIYFGIYFGSRFGGDSRKVTIFGESVGGMNVALLLLSPLASGLYQNVIIQSGTAVTLSALFEKDEAELRAR